MLCDMINSTGSLNTRQCSSAVSFTGSMPRLAELDHIIFIYRLAGSQPELGPRNNVESVEFNPAPVYAIFTIRSIKQALNLDGASLSC